MQLTRFTDIGLRVVMRLISDEEGTTRTTRELASDLAVPYAHVAKVIGRLSEMGVVHSRRGRSGGVAITDLGRTARVGWLARSLEGEDEVVDCAGPVPCPLRSGCRLRSALARAQAAFFASLDEHSICDLVAPAAAGVVLNILPSGQIPIHAVVGAADTASTISHLG